MTATCGRTPPSPMAGSWFPTGFHGHFRSKSRNDFICEFRQLARPQPPEKFFRRSSLPPAKNVFSRHDNRHSFLSDAMYFEQGLGRRRIKRSTFAYNPELLTWMPSQRELRMGGPHLTHYQTNFSAGRGNEQILITPIQTSFDNAPTSTYRYVHGEANPQKDTLHNLGREALNTTYMNRKPKPPNVHGRESVASCLSWYTPQPPRTPPGVVPSRSCTNIPAATAVCLPSTPPAAAERVEMPPLSLPESS